MASELNEMNLDGMPQNFEAPPPPTDEDDPQQGNAFVSGQLMGTLEVMGDGIYFVFVKQSRNQSIWVMTSRDIYDKPKGAARQECIVALIKVKTSGSMTGLGKTYILTRLLANISAMVYKATASNKIVDGWGMKCDFVDKDGSYIRFTTLFRGRTYTSINMQYEGFLLTVDLSNRAFPFSIPAKLETVHDSSTKAAVVANLGIKTAKMLFRRMGDRLNWYKNKRYMLVDSMPMFNGMMYEFLKDVQRAHDSGRAILVGLDTETTGLHMLDLEPTNPVRDSIVCIPFAWRDDEAFLICTDMYYFSNVEDDAVYPLFNQLFRRNEDYTFQDIELDFGGTHFSFNRQNIIVAGFNSPFDKMAFLCHNCDVFFDEDVRQLFFNLNTDLQQGRVGFERWGTFQLHNSLKMQTRRNIGDETLELDELFGKGHEDKFRYLQDAELALIYGGADADYTRKTFRIAKKLTDPRLYKLYRKYDMTTAHQMAKAVWHGMPIDTEAVKAQGELVLEDLQTLQNFIYHYAWLANRQSIETKSAKLKDLLDLESDVELENISDADQMFRYRFTPANHKKLLFDLLKYPVIKRSKKDGTPALDKYVLQKLIAAKRDNPVEIILSDIMAVSDPSLKLVSKEDFNTDAFPLARIFSVYATLNKEYQSYYKPILDNDMEGRMFYNFSMARAATRRVLSPGQTMKGSLKTLVIAPPGKIFMSWDASQIEYRHMASLAYIRSKSILAQKHKDPAELEQAINELPITRIFNMMQQEEADYHIETAAALTGCRQHEVTKDVRKKYKSIGFGIPYGLSDRSLCENLHGVVNDETMAETLALLEDYKSKQRDIIDLLEDVRDDVFRPASISKELREYLEVGDSHVGIVRNFVGFYRLFILENLTRGRTGRIRRQAGNFIIQGGAAELFRRMLYNFHVGVCNANINDKVQWVMTVHDELDAIIDGDIDIMLLIKVIYENCTLRYPDHIPYYVGINFGSSWYEAKDDASELPTIMVQRMIAAYDAGTFSIPSDGRQAEYLHVLKRHYLCDRITEELKAIIPGVGAGHVWTEKEADTVNEHFTNYVVRAYLDVFSSKKASLLEKLQKWQLARDEYGFGVSFLEEKPWEVSVDIRMDMEGDDFSDLSIDLLSDTDEELDAIVAEENSWFGEVSLFDHNLSEEDILVDIEETTYIAQRDGDGFEEEYSVNDKPTSYYDIYVPNKYIRKKVVKVKDGEYSVLLANTRFNGRERDLLAEVKSRFDPGTDTVLLVGTNILGTKKVSCSDNALDWLDKFVLGECD